MNSQHLKQRRRRLKSFVIRWFEVVALFWQYKEQIFRHNSIEQIQSFQEPLNNQILPSRIAR